MDDDLVYSDNGEDFYDDVGEVLDTIYRECDTPLEVVQRVVYVGKKVLPKINAKLLAEEVVESVQDDLYQKLKEYAESYKPSNVDELEKSISSWLDKQNYRCWGVKCVREVSIMEYTTVLEIEDEFK